jgi:hypothetical protein
MKETKKEYYNMKNILAENMLRFGVKNLSEADRYHLTEITGSTPVKVATPMYKASFASNLGPITFTGTTVKQPNGSFKPDPTIQAYITKKGFLRAQLNPTTGIFGFDTENFGPNYDKARTWLYGTPPMFLINKGINPGTALTQVVAQLNKAAGTAYTIDPKVLQALLPGLNTAVQGNSSVAALSGILAPLQNASMTVYYDPETGAELNKFMYLRNDVYKYSMIAGKLTPAGGTQNALNDDAIKAGLANVTFDRKQFNAALTSLWTTLSAKVVK